MRIHNALTALGIVLVVAATAACSNGTKTSAVHSTTTAVTTTASSITASPAGTTTTSSATSAETTTAAGGVTKDFDACTLLPAARASTLTKSQFTGARSSMIAAGQDQCDYPRAGSTGLTVMVYQPSSGVTWAMLNNVLETTGNTKSVAGLGDKAEVGAIELDVQTGTHFVAVQGAGGLLSGDYSGAVAVAKALVASLH